MKKQILIVDDEAHVTRLVRTQLERAGFGVEVGCNGQDALERLAERSFDLLVTDNCMPRMTGRELCEAVRKQSRNEAMHIIMVTSSPQSDLREWSQQITGLDFMEKPVSLHHLVRRIEELLVDAPASNEAAP